MAKEENLPSELRLLPRAPAMWQMLEVELEALRLSTTILVKYAEKKKQS